MTTRTMINRYKVRKLLAPYGGLWVPAVVVLIGLALFLSGMALSLRLYLIDSINALENWCGEVLKSFVREDRYFIANLMGGEFLVLGIYFVFTGLKRGIRRIMETVP